MHTLVCELARFRGELRAQRGGESHPPTGPAPPAATLVCELPPDEACRYGEIGQSAAFRRKRQRASASGFRLPARRLKPPKNPLCNRGTQTREGVTSPDEAGGAPLRETRGRHRGPAALRPVVRRQRGAAPPAALLKLELRRPRRDTRYRVVPPGTAALQFARPDTRRVTVPPGTAALHFARPDDRYGVHTSVCLMGNAATRTS